MSTLKVESLRHYDADSDALTLSSSGTITFNGTLVGATDSAQVQAQFDSAFPSAFDTRFALQDTHDSAAVQAQIDSAAVTLTGNQTIAGTKTFSSTPKSSNGFEAASAFRFTKSTISGTDNALYYDSDHLYVGRDAKDLRFRTNSGVVAMGIDSAGSIYTGSTGLGDKLSLYDNRLNSANMYGFGIGGSTMYYRSFSNHDFVVNELWDGTNHKVRIDADGIKFHGDTAAANALDDYEEGTFTPQMFHTSGTPTYTYQEGRYTKIGDVVHAHGIIGVSNSTSLGGAIGVTNLPFAVARQGSYGYTMGSVSDGSGFTFPVGNGFYNLVLQSSGNSAIFVGIGTSAGLVTHGATGIAAGLYFRFNLTYYG